MNEFLCLSREGHAFSQSPLSRASRSFRGPILKGSKGEGFRTPGRLRDSGAWSGAGVRKPPKEETAGRKGRLFGRARPMEILGSRTARACRRGGRWRAILAAETMMTIEFGREDAGRWRWRGDRGRTDDLERTSASCSGARSEASAIWFARRDAILIRLGGGERAGRGPSNVSTTIIRPPQHGHRRGDETSSPSLSASAFAFWGETLGAASAWRTRSMLRARTVPANRP